MVEGGHRKKEGPGIKNRDAEKVRERGHVSRCQGIDVSLQLSTVASATKSPSNCSPVPKHLANSQLTSTDAVSLKGSSDKVGGTKQKRKGVKKRDGNVQQNRDNCTYQSQSWC